MPGQKEEEQQHQFSLLCLPPFTGLFLSLSLSLFLSFFVCSHRRCPSLERSHNICLFHSVRYSVVAPAAYNQSDTGRQQTIVQHAPCAFLPPSSSSPPPFVVCCVSLLLLFFPPADGGGSTSCRAPAKFEERQRTTIYQQLVKSWRCRATEPRGANWPRVVVAIRHPTTRSYPAAHGQSSTINCHCCRGAVGAQR